MYLWHIRLDTRPHESPVLAGQRKSLVLELWTGPPLDRGRTSDGNLGHTRVDLGANGLPSMVQIVVASTSLRVSLVASTIAAERCE